MMKYIVGTILNMLLLVSCLETSPSKGEVPFDALYGSLDTVGTEANGVKSIAGITLTGLRFSKSKMKQLEANSMKMEKLYIQFPDSLSILLMYARSLDMKGAYLPARAVYEIGARKFPNTPEILQYKGLNEILTRDFRAAIRDLQTAVFNNQKKAIHPDAYQNQDWVKASAQFYTWYYLGLAYYFNRNYDSAISSFKKCVSYADTDDDLMVIPFFWLYNIYEEIGNQEAAQGFLKDIDTNMLIINSKDYYRGLLLFKGVFKPDRLTRFTIDKNNKVLHPLQAYALIRWYQKNGREEDAKSMTQLLIASNEWNDLGYIACEVDLFTNQNLN